MRECTLTRAVMATLFVLAAASTGWAQSAPPPVGGQGGAPGPGAGMMGGPGMHGGPGHGMGMQRQGGPRDMMNPDMVEALASEVGVDQPTLAKIKGLVFAANREAIDLRADVQRERLTLRQLLDDTQPDTKKVLKQVETVGAAETKIRKNRVQLILQVRELLTPEQRKKLQHLVTERMGRGHGPAWFGPGDE